MIKTRVKYLLLFVLAAVFLISLLASANVLLVPSGGTAMALRTKSISTVATIDRQFTSTTQTLVFQNESYDRMEADFIYTLPPGAVATYFAYWAGDEKVVARIVEKERAAEIYKTITTRQRDPALIELIGKNTFRARIFPVMPNADLKVEIRFVQVLPSDSTGATYTLPLYQGKDQAALDEANVSIHVKTDESITGVTNNYGLPVVRASDGYSITLKGTNYRPSKDLNVHLTQVKAPLRAELYSAPSGGGDGFFALALTPDRSLSRPKVAISGVKTYDVVPTTTTDVKANESMVVFGRYKGSGPATVSLTGASGAGRSVLTARVQFGSQPEPNNLATKLWAAEMIDRLGKNAGNHSRMLEMSQRYTLPSKFSSWLAVPKEEMKLYREEKIKAKAYSVVHRLSEMIISGKGSPKTEAKLRAQLKSLADQIGWTPSDFYNESLYNLRWRAGDELAELIGKGQGTSQRARYLKSRFYRATRVMDEDPTAVLKGFMDSRMSEVAYWLVSEGHGDKPDARRMASLRSQLAILQHASGYPAQDYIDSAEYPYRLGEIEKIKSKLALERAKPNPDAAVTKALNDRLVAVDSKVHNRKYALLRSERLAVRWDIDILDEQIESARKSGDSSKLAELQRKQDELVAREDNLRVRMGDPLIIVDAPADAQRVIALMPSGDTKVLVYNADRQRWEARFDVPSYATEGEYTITIIVVLRDGTRKVLKMHYRVDITPPQGKAQLRASTQTDHKLRLQLDADDDTARIVALLPWGDRVEMKPSSQPHRFFALVPIPSGANVVRPKVTFILTDKAHNRTAITMDMDAEQ